MEIVDQKINIEQKAQELISLIKTRFITEDGLLARNYPVKNRTLFDNFDDIVPFFIFFKETDFLLSQIRILKEKNESMLSLCCEDGVLITRNIDEWFGGLYALWKETGDTATYDLLTESVEFVLKQLVKDGFLSAAFYRDRGSCAAFYESWSSGLLEAFCEMREDFPSAFEEAQKVLRSWIQNDYFQRHNLFPYRIYSQPFTDFIQRKFLSGLFPLRKSSKPLLVAGRGTKHIPKGLVKQMIFYGTNGLYSQLMKSNSTCAFALLEFYRVTKENFWLENLIKWIDSATKNFCQNGKVYMEFVPRSRNKREAGVVPAFILVDVLCDAVFFAEHAISNRKNELFSVAKEIIDYQLQNRLKNGLIPCYDDGDFAHIDDQIDFGVSMRRYGELSGQDRYKAASIELTSKAIEQHYSCDGYFTYSGRKPSNVIDPKYNALLLKGFINLMTVNESIYPEHYGLFKDR
ncbi:MAG: hypothetical protein JW912_08160 [Sedimentisphaerales bacterium]|nr:hypothetical protein [Sedimentisphaerales bacterium]